MDSNSTTTTTTTVPVALGNGGYTQVDATDAEGVRAVRWWRSVEGYVTGKVGGKNYRLHRYLLDPPASMEVDHIDGNPLNNSRSNLRLATRAQNRRNSRKQPGCTSRYKGVTWFKGRDCWLAQIHYRVGPGRTRCEKLGQYRDEAAAARAYARGACCLLGGCAGPHFPVSAWVHGCQSSDDYPDVLVGVEVACWA